MYENITKHMIITIEVAAELWKSVGKISYPLKPRGWYQIQRALKAREMA